MKVLCQGYSQLSNFSAYCVCSSSRILAQIINLSCVVCFQAEGCGRAAINWIMFSQLAVFCRFAHPAGPAPTPPPSVQPVCRYWRFGTCRYGSACRFRCAHVLASPVPAPSLPRSVLADTGAACACLLFNSSVGRGGNQPAVNVLCSSVALLPACVDCCGNGFGLAVLHGCAPCHVASKQLLLPKLYWDQWLDATYVVCRHPLQSEPVMKPLSASVPSMSVYDAQLQQQRTRNLGLTDAEVLSLLSQGSQPLQDTNGLLSTLQSFQRMQLNQR